MNPFIDLCHEAGLVNLLVSCILFKRTNIYSKTLNSYVNLSEIRIAFSCGLIGNTFPPKYINNNAADKLAIVIIFTI